MPKPNKPKKRAVRYFITSLCLNNCWRINRNSTVTHWDGDADKAYKSAITPRELQRDVNTYPKNSKFIPASRARKLFPKLFKGAK